MRNTLAIITACAFAALALPITANEKPPEAYQGAMRENGGAFRAVRAAVKALEEAVAGEQDYEPFASATTTLKASFETILTYWRAKGSADAVQWAQDGVKDIADLELAVKDKDYRRILASSTALGETCAACHMAHRVQLPDKSYEIK